MFSVENNLLTPTLKAKRRDMYRLFQDKINQMYNELEQQSF